MMFNGMVLSGGSFRAICFVGCIRFLEELQMMDNIKTFVGTSAGSFICLCASLGMTSTEIIDFIKETLSNDYITKLDFSECFDILTTYGVNSGVFIERLIGDVITKKLGVGDITFLELAKTTGKNLVVCVGNITKEKEEYWNVDTTPSMSIIKAIRASCSLPVIFTPVNYKGNMYVDGGIYDHFPIHYFEKKNMSNVVGVLIDTHTPNRNVDTLFQYLQRLLTSTMNVAFRKNIEKELHGNIVTLKIEDVGLFKYDTFQLSLTRDMIDEYFMMGYNEAKTQLSHTMSSL